MNKSHFIKKIKELKVKKCWSIIGPSAGSIFSFDFGKKILIEKQLTNPNLNSEQKKYMGEYSLLIYCYWRLEIDNKVICSSESSDDMMKNGLELLINKEVIDINVYKPAFDLFIHFEDNSIFKIFCIFTDKDDMDLNYDFYNQTGCFTVGCKGEITYEPNQSLN